MNPALNQQPPAESRGSLYDAVELLFVYRHQLPSDILRSLTCIWSCASAARYGEPHERFWELDEECNFYGRHRVAGCEATDVDEAGCEL